MLLQLIIYYNINICDVTGQNQVLVAICHLITNSVLRNFIGKRNLSYNLTFYWHIILEETILEIEINLILNYYRTQLI